MDADEDLVRQAAAGDTGAWDTLVDRHSQMIYANSRVVGANRTLAEDIVQVTWMRLLTRLGTIEPTNVKGWLAIVARNATRSEMRRAYHRDDELDHLIGLATAGNVEDDALRNADTAAMRRAFASLGQPCRHLLRMLFFADMSYAEVADDMEIPIGSVSAQRRSCLADLRKSMGERDGDVNA